MVGDLVSKTGWEGSIPSLSAIDDFGGSIIRE